MKLLILAALVAYTTAAATPNKAIAVLKTNDAATPIEGTITFTEVENGVKVEGTIKGLAPGKHGFHVHEKGDLSKGCASTGSHFNPHNKHHGAPDAEERHVGDLGNVEANADKVATINFVDKLISLHGNHNIVGRAIVVHADPDDLGKGNKNDSLTTGHAGARLACAIIGIPESSQGASLLTTSLLFAGTFVLSILINVS